MNMKKLTLLIALSISMTIPFFMPITTTVESKTITVESSIVQEYELEDIDPLPQIAVEEKVNKIEEEPKKELLPIDKVAKQVIAGKWGSGKERKKKLTEAGYNYKKVQAEVEKLMPEPEVKETVAAVELPKGKYPEAQLIWDTLTSWGWNPETCAGIMGNMMAEIGGGTLDLSNWNSNGGCGYGLIQWTGGRRDLIKYRYGSYPTIEQQLIFMRDELFGKNSTSQQVDDYVLDIIMNTSGNETPESIALNFACYYERCGESYRYIRQSYARIAYEYFNNK